MAHLNGLSESEEETQSLLPKTNQHAPKHSANDVDCDDKRLRQQAAGAHAPQQCGAALSSIDDILTKELGQFGKAQQCTLLVSGLSFVIVAVVMFLPTFTTPDDPSKSAGQWYCTHNPTQDPICYQVWNAVRNSNALNGNPTPAAASSDYQPSFCDLSRDQYAWVRPHTSLATQFDLVCGNSWKIDALQAFFFVGFMTGNGILGKAADMYGRKRVMLATCATLLILTLMSAAAPLFWIHAALRALTGSFTAGCCLSGYVLIGEMVGPAWRGTAGMLVQTFYILGEFLLVALAVVTESGGWRMLTVASTLPAVLLLLVGWLVPESPRWLLIDGRQAQATRTLQWIARQNGTQLLSTPSLSTPAAETALEAPGAAAALSNSSSTDSLELVVQNDTATVDTAQRALATHTLGSQPSTVVVVHQRPVPVSRTARRQSVTSSIHNNNSNNIISNSNVAGHGSATAGTVVPTAGAHASPAPHGKARHHVAMQEQRATVMQPHWQGVGEHTVHQRHVHMSPLQDDVHTGRQDGGSKHSHTLNVKAGPGSGVRIASIHHDNSSEDEVQEDAALLATTPALKKQQAAACQDGADKEASQEQSLWQLLQHRKLAQLFLATTYTMCTLSMAYFGVTLALGTLSGSLRLNFFLTAAAELPAYLGIAAFVEHLGRKPVVLLGAAMSGVALLAVSFVSGGVAQVLLAVIGKFGCSGAWALGLTYVSELFPTSCRSAAVGAISQAGDLGGIIAPLLMLLGQHLMWTRFPFVVMGICACIGAYMVTFLPETRGMPQADTIQDMLVNLHGHAHQ